MNNTFLSNKYTKWHFAIIDNTKKFKEHNEGTMQ